MGKLVRHMDSSRGCFARVDFAPGDPLWISIAQNGVLIRRSRLGLFGRRVYGETDTFEAARVARVLATLCPDVSSIEGVHTPMLSAFLAAALSARNLVAFEGLLAAARWVEIGLIGSADDAARIQQVVHQIGSALEASGASPLGFPEELLPLSGAALKEILWLATVAQLQGDADEPKRVEPLAFAYSHIALAVPEQYAEAHAAASALLLADDLSKLDEPWFKAVMERYRPRSSQAATDAAEFLARLQSHTPASV